MHWRSILLLSCCLLGSRTVLGGTRVVPTQYATIQAAVDASAPGDTVLVHPGIYLENPIIAVDLHIVRVLALVEDIITVIPVGISNDICRVIDCVWLVIGGCVWLVIDHRYVLGQLTTCIRVS